MRLYDTAKIVNPLVVFAAIAFLGACTQQSGSDSTIEPPPPAPVSSQSEVGTPPPPEEDLPPGAKPDPEPAPKPQTTTSKPEVSEADSSLSENPAPKSLEDQQEEKALLELKNAKKLYDTKDTNPRHYLKNRVFSYVADLADILDRLARLKLQKGDTTSAMTYLQRSLKYRKEACNMVPASDKANYRLVHEMKASTLETFASALIGEKKWKEAEQTLNEVVASYKAIDYDRGEAKAIASLADMYKNQGNFKKAAAGYERSIAKLRSIKNKPDLEIVLSNYADVLREQGKLTEATKVDREVQALQQAMAH